MRGNREEVCIINCVTQRERACASLQPSTECGGGNLNTSLIPLSSLMKEIDDRYVIREHDTSSAEQPGMHVVFFHPLRHRPGDMALTFGVHTVQVNSAVGQIYSGASAEHDLVIAQCTMPALPPAPALVVGATPKQSEHKWE